ncbi:DUF1289 domain-containing protein [Leptospira interrogans]|uniref:Fe-S protein n=21 Tax=Leptospira TaxID=171 RepID=Q8EYB9_LEPIN|nr:MULTISPECIES: DUF1289 domain-containing protein [Leptospira]EMF44054.1 PF06945 family protein [Leptospira interrogans serovar Lora str. TE 1992]EMF71873.1 PF06945 family protein [Leptospira interrogans serovar Canicola str. LT1962]EMG08719.1 PF06945 family protein [Leptospira interrogans serovar Grippotyphosa str. LT2186]EMG23911.1 PF06945 family protein [Leptospira interrogans serovar Copenhageni str. LT2050]EMM80472.1 PF06945 family protein [Leptospira interrogans str. 2006001854]EMM9345
MVRSPCNKICSMNFESGLCKGCFRTLEEICNWSSYSETERENLFVKLKIRKEENVSKFNSA